VNFQAKSCALSHSENSVYPAKVLGLQEA